jgi:tetratricopeptide (TPR) repeat protein
MLSRHGRIVVILVCTLAAAFAWQAGFPRWWLLLLAALAFTVGHWRGGPIWLAARAARRGDLARVAELLNEVRRPQILAPQQRAYFHYYAGLVHADRGELAAARENLQIAAAGKLRTPNDRSLVLLQLAELALATGDRDAARKYLEEAGRLRHKPAIAQAIAAVETRLAAG